MENGELILKAEYHNMQGWPEGEAELYTPILEACFDRGGWFLGVFDGAKLVGAVVLESQFIGKQGDKLQMKFLHVSRETRGKGLGKMLFQKAAEQAKKQGARKLYISATPARHTVDFYFKQGCRVTQEPDAELFALEPEDIHLEYALSAINSEE
jgi:predicted N-acetyltransferase YhbS